eukprot:15481910-Heterocapsa_arctica.AAC.1
MSECGLLFWGEPPHINQNALGARPPNAIVRVEESAVPLSVSMVGRQAGRLLRNLGENTGRNICAVLYVKLGDNWGTLKCQYSGIMQHSADSALNIEAKRNNT